MRPRKVMLSNSVQRVNPHSSKAFRENVEEKTLYVCTSATSAAEEACFNTTTEWPPVQCEFHRTCTFECHGDEAYSR